MLTVHQIIETFGMERHQIAGWYAPHYSYSELKGRPKLSSVYHLLTAAEPMPLHKLDAIEVWHFHMGAPMEMLVTNGSGVREISILGTDLAASQRPQLAVPAYFSQSCRTLGEWTLLGCTMSPGYSPHAAFIVSPDD